MFALVIAYSTLKYTQSFLTKAEFKYFFLVAAVSAAGLIFSSVVGLTWAGECIYVFLLFLACLTTVKPVLRGHFWDKRKCGLIGQVTSEKRFNSYETFYDRTR